MNLVEANYQWYKENYERLCEKFGDAWLLIKTPESVAAYPTSKEAIDAGYTQYGAGEFSVQETRANKEFPVACIFNVQGEPWKKTED